MIDCAKQEVAICNRWSSTASVYFFYILSRDRSYVVRSFARTVTRRLDITYLRNCLQIFRVFHYFDIISYKFTEMMGI